MASAHEKISIYERRFGNIAIEKGFLTSSELIHALEIQVQEELEQGRHRLIGQILLERNIMSLEQIKHVLSELF
jgi:hypothetical protein